MTAHLHVSLDVGGHSIELGRLPPGRNGSLVDFGPEPPELVVFSSGYSGAVLSANSLDISVQRFEKWLNLGESYERPITVSGNRAATLRLAVEEDDGG